MEAIPIKIPAQHYLKKYLLHELGPEPIRISKKNRFGASLLRFMEHSAPSQDSKSFDQNDSIEFEISWAYYYKYGCVLTREVACEFNRLVMQDFYRALKNYLDAVMIYKSNLSTDDAIQDFMERYDLDENKISHDALKKQYYRIRKKSKTVKIPADPYLKKYLLHEVGSEPIKINDKNRFGALLLRLLKNSAVNKPTNPNKQGTCIEFQLPWIWLTWNDCSLTKEAERQFKEFVAEDFYSSLKDYIDAGTLYNVDLTVDEGIEDFISRYGINANDISFSSLRKFYQSRWKEMV